MGRSYTPTYRIEFRDHRGWFHAPWNCKTNGRPTNANLKAYLAGYVESLKPGGVNAQIGELFGISFPSEGRIVRQSDNVAVATYYAPKFQAV